MLIDSHCHIHDRGTYNYAFSRQQNSKNSPGDFTPEKLISRAHTAGVEKMICVGTSHQDSLAARDFAEQYAADGIYWSYGIHPDEAGEDIPLATSKSVISNGLGERVIEQSGDPRASKLAISNGLSRGDTRGFPRDRAKARAHREARGRTPRHPLGLNQFALVKPLRTNNLVAIGEVGLDYRSGTANRTAQIKLFERMLQLAKDNSLPVIFHVRDAFDDFFAILDNFPDMKGVVHSFSDSRENLQKSLKKDFYIGVNGLATFAKELPTSDIPLDKMLLETDAPFLTPAPFRGTINEPAHIRDICAYISKIKGESEAEIAQITTKNVRELFKI